jgi:hypothetical protein
MIGGALLPKGLKASGLAVSMAERWPASVRGYLLLRGINQQARNRLE